MPTDAQKKKMYPSAADSAGFGDSPPPRTPGQSDAGYAAVVEEWKRLKRSYRDFPDTVEGNAAYQASRKGK